MDSSQCGDDCLIILNYLQGTCFLQGNIRQSHKMAQWNEKVENASSGAPCLLFFFLNFWRNSVGSTGMSFLWWQESRIHQIPLFKGSTCRITPRNNDCWQVEEKQLIGNFWWFWSQRGVHKKIKYRTAWEISGKLSITWRDYSVIYVKCYSVLRAEESNNISNQCASSRETHK